VEIATASRPKPGESACGDLPVVVSGAERTVIALIDGLGHGEAARAAAQQAGDFVQTHAELPLGALIWQCHRALAHTRGAAMTVISLLHATLALTYAGVGNVQLYAATLEPVRPVPRPGVVGGPAFRTVRESSFKLHHGDMVVMASDGISTALDPTRYRSLCAQAAADAIMRDLAKEHDDASCAVLRL
jgi:phosphoserine phosphatase RsbX